MTLTDVLTRAATIAPGQGIVHADRFVSYAELFADALRIGGGLREAGVSPGDPLPIVADDGADFLGLFWGAVFAGAVPVPLPPEPNRLAAVWRHLDGPPLAGDTATPGGTLLSPRDLRSALPLTTPHPVRPDDLAFLQFSSGSTGTPKGVELTHANVLANLGQSAQAGALTSDDVFVTWMPYFHDMGLIGTHLAPLYARCRQIRISPLAFAKRPALWLATASQHRATVLSAANFALALVNRRVPQPDLDGLDLTSVRLLMVGAEPISPSVWHTFATRLRPAGLRPGALQPVYGLAEATVAVACPPLGEPAIPVTLSRTALSRGVALPALPSGPASSATAGDDSRVVALMDVGYPVPGCELRIVDDAGKVLEDSLVGHLQVRGPNVTRGYHRDPAATAAAFDGEWLRTGDIGFLRSGRLVVTGRHKDVLFLNGRNFHASDLEELAAATPGLAAGPIAVVGATDPATGHERVAVYLSIPAVRPDPAGLPTRVRARIAEALAHDDIRVEVLPNGAFTRTTSGKLRRHPLRERLATSLPHPGWPSPSSGPADDSGESQPGPVAGAGAPLGRADVERVVREIWARVLGVPEEAIGPDDRFLAIGGSSLRALEVLAGLEDAFGRTLDPAMLRDCPTVPAFADRLLAAPGREVAGEPSGPAPAAADQRLAVIGMACRFPGADTPEEFWANLLAGRDSVTPVGRWPGGGHGAFLTDPASFDAGYFGISEDEARLLDPHARIFLELAHEALERSGYAGPRRRSRKIGVFAAVGESGYQEIIAGNQATGSHALTGSLRNLIAARVAHLLDLHGPAIAVDTACSSALVALHLARRSLTAGDCDLAIVGGVNLNLTPTGETLLTAAQALSPTGRCRAFDADADGFVPGEGGAALVLTRFADAGEDQILAVVRGSAVNNDGRSLSLMAPNPLLQREVIADAYRECGVDPAVVSYVEAHGTGTAVGDPIEARSLAHAFPPRPDGRARMLGSVKTNIGHLLNVAGLPALVKVILALKHGELPPSLHHDRPSPRFDLAAAGFEVVTERRPWPGPRTAGVNGFGFGGTNAHVILEAAGSVIGSGVRHEPKDGPHLLTLSARSGPALRAAATRLAAHLREHPELPLADVCASASAGRDEAPYRMAILTENDLAEQLAVAEPGPPPARPARVAFLFADQGAQRPGQGADLYATAPVFRAVLDEVSAATGPVAGRSLVDWCTDPAIPESDLAHTEVTRPLVVAFAVAQAAQLIAYGIQPATAAGDGLGELAAAMTSGRLTAVEAVRTAAGPDRPTAHPARFEDTIDRLRADGFGPMVEVGASVTLSSAVRGTTVRPAGNDASALLRTVGALWSAGASLDRTLLDAGTRRVDVPTYPFQRRRYWITDPPGPALSVPAWTPSPLPPAAAPIPATVVVAGSGDPADALAAITATPRDGFLLLVTRDLFATGDNPPDPRHAVWSGLAMAFADENPDARVRLLDLTSADPEASRRFALRQEADSPPRPGLAELVAWRNGRRLTRSFTPVASTEPLIPPADGSYLIVGGAGAAGAEIARHLARRGRPTLLLAGRSAEPAALLAELRELGATADYRIADVTVEEDVTALVADRHFDIVIQAAGVARPGSLRAKSAAEITAGLSAKVHGTILLTRALADRSPLVIALSSISSVLPGLAGAVGDYVAGNVFLDTFAATEQAAGRRFVTVNLPVLTGGGLATGHGLLPPTGALPLNQLPETLWAAATLNTPQVLATPTTELSPGATATASPGATATASSRVAAVASPGVTVIVAAEVTANAASAEVTAAEVTANAASAEETAAERDELVALVRELLAGPLEREPDSIGLDEPFLALGLDSLTAVDLVKELEERLGRTLSTTLFFEHRTVGELTAHLAPPTASRRSATESAPQNLAEVRPAVADGGYEGAEGRVSDGWVVGCGAAGGQVRRAVADGGYEGAERRVSDGLRSLGFPFSPVQRAFVTTGRLYPEVPAYACVGQTLAGAVDAERLALAFAELERRHPMLRVRFGPGGQYFAAPVDGWPGWFTVVDRLARTAVSDGSRQRSEPAGGTGVDAEWEVELRNRTFDLEREGPVRAVLAVGGGAARLVVVAHHAAADGYSLAVLGDELWALYGGGELEAAPAATFAEHETAPSEADIDHWRAELAGYPRLALPFDGEVDGEPGGPYLVHQEALDPEVSRRLAETARQAGVSLFHLLLAGYVRCLARWSGQSDVPVSVARAGRASRLPGVDRMVGPFADTLPVLVRVRPGESGAELAGRIRELWLTAEQHGSVSTIDLARMLTADGAGPRTASPASFSFARFPNAGATAAGVLATTAATASAATRLGLVCFEAHGTLHFSWNHPAALFTEATIRRLAAEHLAEIIALVEQGAEPSAEPSAGQGTGQGEGRRAGVVERIRAQCGRTPDGIAVLSDGVPLSYRGLDAASDRLAGRLVVGGSRRIGLLTSPGAATVIGVVGILKAGAAWVPMDAAHPPARIAGLLARAGVTEVVHDSGTRAVAEALGAAFTLVDAEAAGETPPLPDRVESGDTAYIIFTSGSTGRPKGVVVGHLAMAGYLDWAIDAFGYRADDRLAQTASISFDASVRQILAPLLVGATVVAWNRDTIRDPELLVELLARDRVTVWSSVPTLWERLLTAAEQSRPDLSRLRWVHVGGEVLSPAHVRRWFDLLGPGQRITNLYGPTETTINATWHLITERPADDVTRLPIGRPAGGAEIEIAGPDGEIWIGGAGLADGYLDDPEQTAAVFVARDGRRWYRSGDLGTLDADGVLWFRGRADDQVKLHGYRIEPGEVEAVLRQHPEVVRAAVLVDGGRLVAWVQSSSVDGPALRAYLAGLLPGYLVPSRFEVAGELPLTAAGKIDRSGLRAGPAVAEPGITGTATERLLAELWSRQLGVASVRPEDDFFALGGDSIGVLELFASLSEHRPALPRPTVLYRHRTLTALAAVIDATTDGETTPAGTSGGDFAVTATQRGFLLADAFGAPSTWLAAPRLHGPLDVERFRRAVAVLVARHPMLRTVFPRDARPPVQRELPSVTPVVGYEPAPRPLDEELAAEREHRFDPAQWPLVRLRLLRYGPEEHVLMVHAHHLAGDGYSVALLMRELLAVYDGGRLEPIRATFREYVSRLAGMPSEIAPHDGGPIRVGGAITTAGFTVRDTAGLRELAAAAGVTPFVPVLTAYHRALASVTGRPDPVIGVAVTGRDHAMADLGRVFGPCATAIAVRPGPGAGPAEVSAAVIDARTRTFTAPQGWRHFFTYLDFGALGAVRGETLRLAWDDTDAELAVPPGTEVLLAVRPVGGGLRLTLRARLSQSVTDELAAAIAADLAAPAAVPDRDLVRRPTESGGAAAEIRGGTPLTAGLVGYLPVPEQVTALPEAVRRLLPALDRETIRRTIFPDGRARLLETVDTPLGRSGFVAVPRFADELGSPGLAEHVAEAVDLAAGQGARTVSLAGMIPANTNYGAAVSPYRRSDVNLTTGHAVTAAAVVRTVLAALAARDRKLPDNVVAVLGLGSIGTSSLSLLLARAEAPAGLILCDLPAAAPRLRELAASLDVPAEVATSADAVYRADVIIAATSSGPRTLDVDRLRPGTILVDDSFPHCFDTSRALARMRTRGDVLIVGGGLLDCGRTVRTAAPGLPAIDRHLPGTIASCQLESLLHAAVPGLPLLDGPVRPEQAAAYWNALDHAGIEAAPLHLLNERLDPERDV
ncbi:amino acid adenylation domain-containing protein [Actinoplanes sp. NPDC026670]|uniref:non-ribosomal peptide synthetase/type I polyketide synthase n=1 Tax=Actinoplanes sp. NPDC026670 TaxID=3154700 RepID=UPI0033EEE6E9